MKKINLKSKFKKFSDQWAPKVVEEMNDYQFKLVKIENDFTWHKHKDTERGSSILKRLGSNSVPSCELSQ